MSNRSNNPFVDKSRRFKNTESPEDLLARITYLQQYMESAANATRILVEKGEFPEQAEQAVDDLVTELYIVFQAWASAIVLESTIAQVAPVTRVQTLGVRGKEQTNPKKDQINE